jgi:hypothetical protein
MVLPPTTSAATAANVSEASGSAVASSSLITHTESTDPPSDDSRRFYDDDDDDDDNDGDDKVGKEIIEQDCDFDPAVLEEARQYFTSSSECAETDAPALSARQEAVTIPPGTRPAPQSHFFSIMGVAYRFV